MTKIEINIVADVLKSRMALHTFGNKVKEYINSKKYLLIDDELLIIFNLREADPIDYEFIYLAFEEAIQKSIVNKNLYIAFKAGKWETEELFTAYTKILKLPLEGNKSDRETLLINKISITTINDSNEVEYLTYLSDRHLKVLKEIELHEKMSSGEIQEKFHMNAEETTQVLTDLISSKFIYTSNGPFYHSIKSLIFNS